MAIDEILSLYEGLLSAYIKLKQLGYKTPEDYLKQTKNLSIQRIVT